jgi:predicted ATPase
MPLIRRVGAELADRLQRHRLVTLTGPGGVGKTALAREAIGRLGGDYPMGAHVVDLTRVDAPDAIGGAIAAQLGFPSLSALLSSPTDPPVLVLIDNCEHVIDAAALAISQLLDSCESPTVLATSRSPLDLPDETVVLVGPLALPPAGSPDDENPSVELFCARARQAGAVLTDADRADVADLCRSLDGLPLAIELAAARTRTSSPAEIARQLDLDTLSRPTFRGPRRHRRLRATIEWSYRLLDPADRRLFDRLGLAGEFTAETAMRAASRSPRRRSPASTLVGASMPRGAPWPDGALPAADTLGRCPGDSRRATPSRRGAVRRTLDAALAAVSPVDAAGTCLWCTSARHGIPPRPGHWLTTLTAPER